MPRPSLNKKQKEELKELLNKYSRWLSDRINLYKRPAIKYLYKMPAADNQDWVMKVDGTKIDFNTSISKKCSFDFFKLVVLHEFFHLDVQKVPNKSDAIRIKDAFGDQFMKLIDIEADYYTALFFKEHLGYSLVDYMKLSYDGNKIFTDARIRPGKLERFIGTLLSIVRMYINSEQGTYHSLSLCDLYLPTISPVYTENSLRILVVRKEHIYLDEISASYKDFIKVKKCYVYEGEMTEKKYIEDLLAFSYKALNQKMPKSVKTEIAKII